ncbi:hypothetical protein ABK040_002012 [Willaertia magna]
MSSYIREQKRIVRQNIKKYMTESCEKIHNGQYTGEDLAKEVREYRSTEKPSNFYVWKKIHRGTGVAASWKDDNFFKWSVKELTRARTFPWLVAGFSWFAFINLLPRPSKEDKQNSPNFHPHGYPNGSKLNDHYGHLVHEVEEPPKF